MEKIVTIDMAIDAIKAAADEIPADDFLSYSTVLDVHLSYAIEEFTPDEQYRLLETLSETLDTHEDLARDISWDLISVLLPFLESPSPATVQIAEATIASAAAKGNPREVFIKVVESLSGIVWSPPTQEDGGDLEDEGEDEDEDEEDGDGDGDGDGDRKEEKTRTRKQATSNALRKFYALLSALSIVHPRIFAKFPSRFLSTQLTTLLGAFAKSVRWLEREDVDSLVRSLVEFVELVKPTLVARRGRSISRGERPPLPPRASVGGIPGPVADSESATDVAGAEVDSPETSLQARLLQSFLSHVLETYLLRTKSTGGRGLVVGWAGQYDAEVVRRGKSKVPGGMTAIDDERAERAAQRDVKALTEDIERLCDILGLGTDELMEVCEGEEGPSVLYPTIQVAVSLTIPDPDSASDDDNEETAPPVSAEDIPLSKAGALFILVQRLTHHPLSSFSIFPNHSNISRSFLVNGSGQHQPAVVDAVLFLGALGLHQGGGLGASSDLEDFLLYLRTFAAISATSPSAQARFLAHYHVATCIRKHPDEAFRLAYIKDTLEYCPFETLKAEVVGILKDEIIAATSPSAPPNSIFATPVVLEELFDVLFPGFEDLSELETFKNCYPTLNATANLYYFLVLSAVCREKLGVQNPDQIAKVDARFITPLGKVLETLAGQDKSGMRVGILKDILGRTKEKLAEVCN